MKSLRIIVAALLCGFSKNVLSAEIKSKNQLDRLREEAIAIVDQAIPRTNDSSFLCNGRLTLTSGTAVTTSDVTAAGTVYFTPYNGSRVSLYSGSQWDIVSFSETSVSVPATSTTPFDVFAYNNSGTLTLETVNWTNDTTRATALTTQDGVYVKSGATTRRYLGTGRTTGVSGQIEDSVSKRFLWNFCNRTPRKLTAKNSTYTWTYNTTTWRSGNNSTTTGSYRIEFVVGLDLEPIAITLMGPHSGTASTDVSTGIGINSTSTNSADFYGSSSNAVYPSSVSFLTTTPSVGYSYVQWLEIVGALTNMYGYANSAANGFYQTGLLAELWS